MRALVIDRHPVVRRALGLALADAGAMVVGEAPTAPAALDACHRSSPDVVLVESPGSTTSGLADLAALCLACGDGRVIVVARQEDPAHVLYALRAGVAGYLLAHRLGSDLAAALDRVRAGGIALAAGVATRALIALAANPAPLSRPVGDAAHGALTPRESTVLELLARGLTNIEIAERLVLAPATVKLHVHRIIGKLGVANRTQAAVYAAVHGLLPPDAHLDA